MNDLEKKTQKMKEKNIWKFILFSSFPMMIYLVFNNISNNIDLFFLKNKFGLKEISMFSQINGAKKIIFTFVFSIIIAGISLIAREYSLKNFEKMNKLSNFFLVFSFFFVIFVLSFFIYFRAPFLKLLNIKEDFIEDKYGKSYFLLSLSSLFFVTINMIILGFERIQKHNSKVFFLNLFNFFLKIFISYFLCVCISPDKRLSSEENLENYVFYVSLSTLISDFLLTVISLFVIFNKKNLFRINLKKASFDKNFLKKLFQLFLSIFSIRISNILTKVILNFSIINETTNGVITVATYSLVSFFIGIIYNIEISFEETQSFLVNKNIEKNNFHETFQILKKTLTLVIVIAFMTLLFIFFQWESIFNFLNKNKNNIEEIRGIFQTLIYFDFFSSLISVFNLLIMSVLLSYKRIYSVLFLNFLKMFLIGFVFLILNSFKYFSSHQLLGMSLLLNNIVIFSITLVFFFSIYKKTKD
ncbi:MATE family efflux transporter [Italian clover phyllody phytoplasma]|uniref:MATE family efflux transporter n=1 Tax=Italian clover phyllody phytoplasma TaxID=1196420 RepID=UPI0002DE11A0|nr:MATE family efflux transporter [Italian clover phyllody phytoplasma]